MGDEPASLTFVVEGEPESKARPRAMLTRGGKIHIYTPDQTAAYEERIGWAARLAMHSLGWREPREADRFAVAVRLYFATRRRRDIDNVVKALLDGMTPLVFLDDWQVSALTVARVLADPRPRALVTVTRTLELEVIGREKPRHVRRVSSPSQVLPRARDEAPALPGMAGLLVPDGGGDTKR